MVATGDTTGESDAVGESALLALLLETARSNAVRSEALSRLRERTTGLWRIVMLLCEIDAKSTHECVTPRECGQKKRKYSYRLS